ncbi:hypothetical protein D3C79_988940 [compost metagenome]
MQRGQLLFRNRFTKVLFRQRPERRQRLLSLWAVGNQPDGVAVPHLQQRQLIEATRVGALPLFFQHQLGLKGRQRFRQPRRRSGV